MPEKFTLTLPPEEIPAANQAGDIPASEQTTLSAMTIEDIETDIKSKAVQLSENIISIGRMLIEVKGRLEHGQFMNWLNEKVSFSPSTANNFMRIARELPKTPSLIGLPHTKVLALLDIPEDQREQFAQDIQADEKSTREIQRLIKAANDAEIARQKAEKRASDAETQLDTQTRIAAQQQTLAEQYSEQYYSENTRANQLEAQLSAAKAAAPDAVEVEVPPADYEQLKAQAAQEKQRADDAEKYAEEQETSLRQAQTDLRKLKETRADMPLQGDSPLSLDSFSFTIKQFMGQVGLATSMAPFFRAMDHDTLSAYGYWEDVLSEWVEGTRQALGEATQYVDADSAVV